MTRPLIPKRAYTAHLRTLVPKAIPGMVFGTKILKWAVCGPLGHCSRTFIMHSFLSRHTCTLAAHANPKTWDAVEELVK